MTDNEIREMFVGLPKLSGWRNQEEVACLRDYALRQVGDAITDVDAWVERIGGRRQKDRPKRTLGPYFGQPPIPEHEIYVLPKSALVSDPPERLS